MAHDRHMKIEIAGKPVATHGEVRRVPLTELQPQVDRLPVMPVGNRITLNNRRQITDTDIHELVTTEAVSALRPNQRRALIQFRVMISEGKTLTPDQLEYLTNLVEICSR